MTMQQFYNDFLNKLIPLYESREAANITDWIFENVTGLNRLERSINKNIELTDAYVHRLEKYLEELLQHKPVQYVLQEAWFYKMKFFVNEYVLIPRPETEELVEWIVEDIRSEMYDVRCDEFQLLDIGTGSGCIAISLKKELENIDVTAIDVSEDALSVANKNAIALQAQIGFLKINFFIAMRLTYFNKVAPRQFMLFINNILLVFVFYMKIRHTGKIKKNRLHSTNYV